MLIFIRPRHFILFGVLIKGKREHRRIYLKVIRYIGGTALKKTDGVMLIIPKIVHQAWLSGDSLKARYYPWRLSWVMLNPEMSFMFWEPNNIPYDKFTPEGSKLLQMKLKFGVKSDIIRWELLYIFGGIWADMDTECLRPLEEYLFALESFAGISVYPDGIGNAIVGTIPHNPLMAEIRDATNAAVLSDIPRSFDNKRLGAAHGATFAGSNYLFRVAKILPKNYFYPFHPIDSWKIRKNPPADLKAAFPETIILHRWEGAAPDGWGHVDY